MQRGHQDKPKFQQGRPLDAERLADVMLALAAKPPQCIEKLRLASVPKQPLIKLPPVFTASDSSRYGDGRRNLVAMIKVIGEYEDGLSGGSRLTLADLPSRYNLYDGSPKLTARDMRRVHNWLQQVSFGLRAAMLECEEREPAPGMEGVPVAERVARKLCGKGYFRHAFVTFSPDNPYEYKPLRDVPFPTVKHWVEQELAQLHNWKRGLNVTFGARPKTMEWEAYGIRQQSRAVVAQIASDIETMVKEAALADEEGRAQEADMIYASMQAMSRNLDYFDLWEKAAAR